MIFSVQELEIGCRGPEGGFELQLNENHDRRGRGMLRGCLRMRERGEEIFGDQHKTRKRRMVTRVTEEEKGEHVVNL